MAVQYIHSWWLDSLLIVGSPLISLLFVYWMCEPRPPGGSFILPQHKPVHLATLAAILINAHVLLVVLRSHVNRQVFSRFPLRFTLIPLAVFGALAAWDELFLFMIPIAAIWDEYHSFMQTFGFGRIYEQLAGNGGQFARGLDMAFCFAFEYLPYIILLTLMPFRDLLQELDWGSSPWVLEIARQFPRLQPLLFGILILCFSAYLLRFTLFRPETYRAPLLKWILFLTTGFVNIYAIFNYTLFEATVIGNIYHALQYFAIIWISERKNVSSRAGVDHSKIGKAVLFAGLSGVLVGLAFLRLHTTGWALLGALWMTTSLMHFWYDGFIWSVRRSEVV